MGEKQEEIDTSIEKYRTMLISATVPVGYNKKRKELGMTWKGLIQRGIESVDFFKAQEEFMQEYKKLKEKQQRTAQLLQQYVDESRKENEVA